MRLNKWLYGVMALGMMAACSETDLPGDNDASKTPVATANGYLALRINLPQQSSTRAAADGSGSGDNVQYADGEAWEYKVDNATLVIYKGSPDTKEADLEYVSSYTLDKSFPATSPSDNNISASSIQGVQVNIDYSASNDPVLWALVLLNVPTDLQTPKKLSEAASAKKKFSDYLAETTKVPFSGSAIFMTNAPLANKPGGDSNPAGVAVQTLVKLGKASDVVKSTLAEAKENVAGCIYVERAVAKLTANVNTTNVVMWDENGKDESDETKNRLSVKVAEAHFGVMNINPISYIVRRVTGFPTSSESDGFSWTRASTLFKEGSTYSSAYYRMIGSEKMPKVYDPMHTQDQDLFRTYWCHDPNYNSENQLTGATDSEFKKLLTDEGKQNAFYVKENTFNVKNMNYGNSTLAAFKIKFEVKDKDGNEAEHLYVLNENRNAVYTSLNDVLSHARNYILGQENVKDALVKSTKTGAVGTDVELGKYLKINLAVDDKDEVLIDDDGTITIASISLDKAVGGYSTYYGDDADTKFAASLPASAMSELMDRVNKHYTIEMYKDCYSYYVIPVMHFGDKSTPWYKSDKNQATTDESYKEEGKYNADAYLGRYGMVRNNWYEVTVNSFTGIGSPVVPSFRADLANDNNEVKRYIGVETHILSWAKRNQTNDF